MKVILGMTGDRQDDVQYSVAVDLLWMDRGRITASLQQVDPGALHLLRLLVVSTQQGRRRVRRTWGFLAMQAKTRKKLKVLKLLLSKDGQLLN